MQKQNTHYTKLWPYQTLPALPLSLSPLTRRLSTALATTKTWPVRLKRSRATATALQGRAKQSSSFTVASTIRCSPSAVHLQSICSPSAVHLHSITHSVFTKEAHTHTHDLCPPLPPLLSALKKMASSCWPCFHSVLSRLFSSWLSKSPHRIHLV